MTERPGDGWMAILRRDTPEQFGAAFTADVSLTLSASDGSFTGPVAVRGFFQTTSTMYDDIEFNHESSAQQRRTLEWQGRFLGEPISVVSLLSYDDGGLIAEIQLYHRPLRQVVAFSSELARRLG